MRDGFASGSRGAAQIVEMTLVLPLVFSVLLALFCAGVRMYTGCVLQYAAGRAAMLAAKEEILPGYLSFYADKGLNSSTDFGLGAGRDPGNDTMNSVMSVREPYRYISGNAERLAAEEEILSAFVNDCSVLPSDFRCSVIPSDGDFGRTVTVRITGTYSPLTVGLYRLKTGEADVTRTASVSGSSEVIRNTELAADLCDFLWDKLKLGKDGASFSERVSTFSDSIRNGIDGFLAGKSGKQNMSR